MSRLSIFYGRIRFLDPHPGQETLIPRIHPIRDAIEAATSTSRYGHDWVLGNLEVMESADLVVGRLGYPETERGTQQDYDEEHHRFVDVSYELPDAVSLPFVINYVTGAIAFEANNKIRPTGFINHLVALLNQSGRGQFKGELVRIAQNYRDFLTTVDKVLRVSFEVHPTNPRDREIFRPLDQGMKAANAARQRTAIENQEEGLILDPPETRDEPSSNPAVQGIEMVEEGYGERYRIDAELEGQPVRYDSRDGGLLRDVVDDAPENPEDRARRLIENLDQRADLLEPGRAPAPPLETSEDEGEGQTKDKSDFEDDSSDEP
jgi:hypothetical protein